MIEIINKEWAKLKLVIFTTETNELIDVKVIESELNHKQLQEFINLVKDNQCGECAEKDNANCIICKQKQLEEILVSLEAMSHIDVVKTPIGLKVIKGIEI